MLRTVMFAIQTTSSVCQTACQIALNAQGSSKSLRNISNGKSLIEKDATKSPTLEELEERNFVTLSAMDSLGLSAIDCK